MMYEANSIEETSSSASEIPTCVAQIYFPKIAKLTYKTHINYQDFYTLSKLT